MKQARLAIAVVGFVLLCGRLLWADDMVYVQEPGKKSEDRISGTIEKETPTGIRLKTKSGVKEIPAAQITQVVYDNKSGVDAIAFRDPFKNESNALRDGTKPDKRADLLKTALLGYQELDTKLRGEANAHRYLQYKIAHVTALQAKDDPSRTDAAIAALIEFKTNNADGWEIVPALQLLARLQEEKGDAEGASKTYSDLAEVPGVPAATKLQNQLLGAKLLLRINKFTDAETKLKQIEATMAADDPQRTFVDVYVAQTQMAQGRLDGVEAKLKAAILASEDKNLRAVSHNFLGDYHRLKKESDLAFWEYLKVDTLYNDDREEHAKALYYLSQLFDKPKNDPVRAEQCLAKLKSKDFEGTLYQRMAAGDKKSP
jgi:hypothetical protein